MSRERIRTVEEKAFRGWPALESRDEAGWRLRFSAGYTKRANSINALGCDDRIDSKIIESLEAPYRARGLRPVWRLTPLAPAGAAEALAARGYPVIEESLLQVCPLHEGFIADPAVQVLPAPTSAWLAAFKAHSPVAPQHHVPMEAMLRSIAAPVGFAFVKEAGQPMAMAIGAVDGDHMGLFDVLVMPAARRRGLARRVTESLYAWAWAQGAHFAYLQVVATNASALPLYAAQGFETVYGYHYRAPPA